METGARGKTLDAGAAAAAAGLIYLATLSARYTYDGVLFAFGLDRMRQGGEPDMHPHHLLYGPVTRASAAVLDGVGLQLSSMLILQLFSVLCGAAAVFVFVRVVQGWIDDRVLVVTAAAGMAFSLGVWLFSVDPEVYVPLIVVELITLNVLLHRLRSGPTHAWPVESLGYGVLGWLLMAAHLEAGALLLPMGLVTLCKLRDGGWRRGIAPSFIMVGTAFTLFLALAAYGHAAQENARAKPLFDWLILTASGNAQYMGTSFWNLSPGAVPAALGGYADALVAGPAMRMRDADWLAVCRVVAILGFVVSLGLYAPRARSWPHLVLVMATVPLLLFNVVWDAGNFEAKIAVLPPLWIAAALGWHGRKGARVVLPTVVLLLAVHNYVGAIEPGSDPVNNRDLQRSLFIAEHTEEDAHVVIAATPSGFNNGKIYLLYFAHRQAWSLHLLNEARGFPHGLNALAATVGIPRMYVLSEVIEPGRARAELVAHAPSEEAIAAWFAAHDPVLVARMADGFALYRLTR